MKHAALPHRLKFLILLTLLVPYLAGCSTKQYARNRVNERVAPLETRTGELEETSRRNTMELSRVQSDVQETLQRVDRTQQQSDRAIASAEQANVRVSEIESAVATNAKQLAATTERAVQLKLQADEASRQAAEAKSRADELERELARAVMGSRHGTIAPPSTSPAPQNPSAGAGNDGDKIKAALKKLVPGTIQFKTPTDMVVGRVETIEALITSLTNDLTKELKGEGTPQIESIRIAALMKVVLSAKDKDSFQITPVGEPDALRVVDTESGAPTKWNWDVKPLKGGTNTLHLTVSAFVFTEDRAPSFITTFDRDITIKANYAYSAGEIIKSAWQFLASAIIIPLVIFGWNTYSKKRKQRSQPAAPFE